MPLKQSTKRTNTTRELIHDDFSGGLNYKDDPSLIAPNQTPRCQNVRVRDKTLTQRPGYRKLYATSLGAGEIKGLGTYHKSDGADYRLIAHESNLCTQANNDQPLVVKSGLTSGKATFFTLADVSYMLNGNNYVSYNGEICTDVVGYLPTVLVGRSPVGIPNAGDVYQNFNLISAGFGVSFSADGISNVFTVPYKNLDATVTTALVNGTIMNEGTGFTLNRATGEYTFSIIPAIGTDNVVPIVWKESLVHPEYIKNCTIAETYGGKTSATVFFTGNPNFPDQVWHSRLYGENYSPDYFPDDAWQKIPGYVIGLSHLYDYLLIVHSKGHGALSYIDGPGGYPVFPYADINSEKGSSIPGSVQEINNSVVFASHGRGVMQAIADTTVNNFLSVNDLSELINKDSRGLSLGLLNEFNLANAVSYNYDGYYGLCVNDVCYVWDYKTNAWLYDTNIPASCFAVIDNTLCFGSNTDGMVYQFDSSLMNDDGVIIDGNYFTKEDNAGTPTWIKIVNHLDLTAKPLTSSSIILSFISSKINSVVFSTNLSSTNLLFPIVKRKRMSKRANYFQFEFRNNILNEGMSIISLKTEYDQGSEMR